MNKFSSLLAFVIVSSISLSSLAEEQKPADAVNIDQDVGYFFGYTFGNMLLEGGNEGVDVEALVKGIKDSIARTQPSLTDERQNEVIAEITRRRQALVDLQVARMLESSRAFMSQNRDKEGVQQTDTGLQYLVLEEGQGATPGATDKVIVHYEGRLINDQVFDSSRQRGEPATFQVDQVIAGWTEGLQLMKTGGKARLFVPPELGYGPGGTRSGIPPNAVLVFDVELIEVVAAES